MKVKCAKEHIEKIKIVCHEILDFEKRHEELDEEDGFLCDALGFLCDYKIVLEKAIEEAELNI